jgi:hypothetical protein
MIIGYSVVLVDDDLTVKDVLWERRVVHSTWEKTLLYAEKVLNDVKLKYDFSENNEKFTIKSLINSNSQSDCEKYGQVCLYDITTKYYTDSIYVVPVYDE